jgi:hypothetical protein
MRHLASVAIVAVGCVGISATPGHAASPYDGQWSGQSAAGDACAGLTVTLTVTDGTVSGFGRAPYGAAAYVPATIGPDGKVTLLLRGGNSGRVLAGKNLYVTFTDDHFEGRGNLACGDLVVTGTRISH